MNIKCGLWKGFYIKTSVEFLEIVYKASQIIAHRSVQPFILNWHNRKILSFIFVLKTMKNGKVKSIREFYTDKSILISGGTGFLGKTLIEKLLRSCDGVKRIFVLLRGKKGKSAEERTESFKKEVVIWCIIPTENDFQTLTNTFFPHYYFNIKKRFFKYYERQILQHWTN